MFKFFKLIKNIFNTIQYYGDATNEYNFQKEYAAEFIRYMKAR